MSAGSGAKPRPLASGEAAIFSYCEGQGVKTRSIPGQGVSVCSLRCPLAGCKEPQRLEPCVFGPPVLSAPLPTPRRRRRPHGPILHPLALRCRTHVRLQVLHLLSGDVGSIGVQAGGRHPCGHAHNVGGDKDQAGAAGRAGGGAATRMRGAPCFVGLGPAWHARAWREAGRTCDLLASISMRR